MPPTLDELRSRHVVTGVPSSDDLIPYVDVDEVGNSVVKKSLVSSIGVALGLDDGSGNLTADGIVLNDAAATVPENNELVISSGELAIGNAVRTGGVRVLPRRFLKYYVDNGLELDGTSGGAVVSLGSIPIFADEAVVGTIIELRGTITVQNVGTKPDTLFLSFVPEESEGVFLNGAGFIISAADATLDATLAVFTLVGRLELSADVTGKFSLNLNSDHFSILASDATVPLQKWGGVADGNAVVVPVPGSLAADQNIMIELQVDNSATIGSIVVSCDISFNFVTP